MVEQETLPAGTWVVPTDQAFAALAREVLDVQEYPDIREYAGGPPDQPYDAAGWTLPIAMGVRTLAARTPLSADLRSALRSLGAGASPSLKPTPYDGTTSADAAPFDSVPGIGFDSSPTAKAIVPPDGRLAGTGALLAVDPAQNNAFRAINRALAGGLDVQRVADATRDSVSDRRTVRTGSAGARDVARTRLRAYGCDGHIAPASAHRSLQRAHQHGCGVDALGARALRLSLPARLRRRHRGGCASQPG